jgi:hypothetical protein
VVIRGSMRMCNWEVGLDTDTILSLPEKDEPQDPVVGWGKEHFPTTATAQQFHRYGPHLTHPERIWHLVCCDCTSRTIRTT